MVLAVVIGAVVASALERASETVGALGSTQPALIATRTIEPGEPLTATNVIVAPRPVGHLPEGAMDDHPLDSVAASTIAAGEIVVEERIVGSDPATALSVGERAVTIPMPLAPPPVRIGTVVDLVAISGGDSPFAASATSLGTGRVTAIGDHAITIATTERRALAVVSQLGSGAIELLITPFEASRGSLGE